ncbi:MAG: NADH-dependent [FeFe] hydrogenase, group A6 [Phycisphaerae bacterium]
MIRNNSITIDGRQVSYEDDGNLLEVIRKANIDLPTFCYHSELSVYGACRLCIVDVEGRGVMASCSIKPEPGMVVRTNTAELREMRKITLELLLADGHENCTTCEKNGRCKLQALARRMGVKDIRFHAKRKKQEMDTSSSALVRDPNKCVLCGDCVRFCHEVQDIGAIDFANRGAGVTVSPAFGRGLGTVECVDCGQCAAVCPTGAITPRNESADVWKELDNPEKVVIAQIAPAVRVAIGEDFGLEPGTIATGQIVAAMKMMGFDKVFDTSFAADLTVIEEANEFLARKTEDKPLPMFTSCCPGWVTFAEQYYPDLLENLSSCRSPQQMFGSVARRMLPEMLGIDPENLVIVSVMPCTAKKHEAEQEKFATDGLPDVDYVITTQELARMVDEAGLQFANLQPESLDMPMGFKTGAGVIFGTTGGVSEAVLRYAAEKLTGVKLQNADFEVVRGEGGLREAELTIGDATLKLAVAHGLRHARQLAEKVRKGEADYDLIEIMACPGGCIGGAGQPVSENADARKLRAKGLYEADKMLQLHKAQDNHYLQSLYEDVLGEPNGHTAHELLHTNYSSKRRVFQPEMHLTGNDGAKVDVSVCVGTSCYVKGAQKLLNELIRHVEEHGLENKVNVRASFCMEACDKGPNVQVGDTVLNKAAFDEVVEVINSRIACPTCSAGCTGCG